MASVKVLLRKDKINEKGLAPLYLRIIKNRRAKFLSLGLYLKPSEWNDEAGKVRKSHSNSARLNAMIAQRIADAEGIAVELETKSKIISSYQIKEKIIGAEPVDFFDFAQRYIDNLKRADKIGASRNAANITAKLKKYCKYKPLYFEDITVTFLIDYKQYLITEYKNKPNTLVSNLKIIRTIINRAVNEDIITRNDNPFYKFKLKWENSKKNFLQEDEIAKIENVDLPLKLQLYRDMYVFAIYAGGLRVSDCLLLRWANFDGEHIHLQMHKTKLDVTVKLPNKALEIINKYKREDSLPQHFVFPLLSNDLDCSDAELLFTQLGKKRSAIDIYIRTVAKKAGIEKHISFHTSRHTFATWALRKGIRIEYVSKLLGHTNIKETQVYAKIVNKELDRAMEVFN